MSTDLLFELRTRIRNSVYRRRRRACGPPVGIRRGRCDTRVRCSVWTAARGLLRYRDRSTLLRRFRRSPAAGFRLLLVRTTIGAGRRLADHRRPANGLRPYRTRRCGTLARNCSPAARSFGPRTTGDRCMTNALPLSSRLPVSSKNEIQQNPFWFVLPYYSIIVCFPLTPSSSNVSRGDSAVSTFLTVTDRRSR